MLAGGWLVRLMGLMGLVGLVRLVGLMGLMRLVGWLDGLSGRRHVVGRGKMWRGMPLLAEVSHGTGLLWLRQRPVWVARVAGGGVAWMARMTRVSRARVWMASGMG